MKDFITTMIAWAALVVFMAGVSLGFAGAWLIGIVLALLGGGTLLWLLFK